jgi:gas vesicle protein
MRTPKSLLGLMVGGLAVVAVAAPSSANELRAHAQPTDQQRLQKIADDTGGKYFALPDSSALQSVMNEIETQLTCQSPPRTFTDALAQGKSKTHNVVLPKKAKFAQIAISWASPLDTFKISRLRIIRGGKVVAKTAKVRKLKIKVNRGATFTVVKVSRLVKGKLRFTVKATKIGSGQPKVTLTTQVSQTRRR